MSVERVKFPYWFEYSGSADGFKKAVVYKWSDQYAENVKVAEFCFGVDAKEYVRFKNEQHNLG